MDAWLPQYIQDPKGHNLVITRSEKIDELLKNNKAIALNRISIKQVIKSQRGVITRKRSRRVSSKDSPTLRSEVLLPASFLQHKINQLKQKIAFCTNESWSSAKDIDVLNDTCDKYFQKMIFYNRVLKIMNFPSRIIGKITGVVFNIYA